jgi:subtilisin-like proprotein convertase family protein
VAFLLPGRIALADAGTTLFVDADADGKNDGTSWDDAYQSLQDAIEAADIGYRIWVAEGTYRPDQGISQTPGDRAASFQLQFDIKLYGGFDGTETMLAQRDVEAHETILSGDLNGDDLPGFINNGENSLHVVDGSSAGSLNVLDGFTVAGGNADGIFPENRGGGILIFLGSPTIRNCRIVGNASSESGAGMIVDGSPSLTDCRFEANDSGAFGGGVYVPTGSPVFQGCDFVNNSADQGGGLAVGLFAAAVENTGTIIEIINCKFLGNDADFAAGGVYNIANSTINAVNSIFSGCVSTSGGGAILNASTTNFTQCTFFGNQGTDGAAIWNFGQLDVDNCIFWQNGDLSEAAQITSSAGTVSVDHSLIQGLTGGLGGVGNVDSDPMFVDSNGADDTIGSDDDNFRLVSGSPAVDSGDNTALPLDSQDLDGDRFFDEVIPVDLDFSTRIVDDPLTPNTGIGSPAVVDMGAYEFFQDCNENGIPDSEDILQGTSMDLDGDGIPDECAFWDGECAPPDDMDWSCFDNWDLGDAFPDNMGEDTFNVIIDGTVDVTPIVNLDVDVDIDSLLIDNATLTAIETNRDLLVVGAGGIGNIEGTIELASNAVVDATAGGIDNYGAMLTGDTASLSAAGQLTIGPDGSYRENPSAAGFSTASVAAGSVLITNVDTLGLCPACTQASMELRDGMSVLCMGNFVMDGTGGVAPLGATAQFVGIDPPKWVVEDTATVEIEEDLILIGNVDIQLMATFFEGQGQGPGVGPQIDLFGSFVNTMENAGLFQWSAGTLNMRASGTEQSFEVAGVDFGGTALGFKSNFALPVLDIESNASVLFRNQIQNAVSADPFAEALYVEELVLGSGSQITLDGCRIYAANVINNGGTIIPADGVQPLAQACCFFDATCSQVSPTACVQNGGAPRGDGTVCASVFSQTSTPNLPIPDGDPVGASDTINQPDAFTISEVEIDVDITHTWVGDLCVTLTHDASNTSAVVIQRIADPGLGCNGGCCACDGDDLTVSLDDDASDSIDDFMDCGQDLPGPIGFFVPHEALSVFDGLDANSTWTLTVADNADLDPGTLDSWTLRLFEGAFCPSTPPPPLADDRFDVKASVKGCDSDADCRAGAGSPDPQTHCRNAACYVARNRYLSVFPNPANGNDPRAYRISLDMNGDGLCTNTALLGFAQATESVTANGPGPSSFDLARVGPSPVFLTPSIDISSGALTIGDCEIAPGDGAHGVPRNWYCVQTLPLGGNPSSESDYSNPLSLPTVAFSGDVTGGGNPGLPPNGQTASLVDAFSAVLGFQQLQNEPKDWLDLDGQVPNLQVSLADAFAAVQAFQQVPYAFPAPLECP